MSKEAEALAKKMKDLPLEEKIKLKNEQIKKEEDKEMSKEDKKFKLVEEDKKYKLSGVGPSTYFDIRTTYLAYVEQCNTAGFDTRPCKAWYELTYKAEFPKFSKEYDFTIIGLMKGPDIPKSDIVTNRQDVNIEADLDYMGVDKKHRISYGHWYRCLEYIVDNDPLEIHRAIPVLLPHVGAGSRYILEYIDSFRDYGIIKQIGNNFVYIGSIRLNREKETKTKGE